MEEWISLREFARRRKPCSLAAVQKAIASDRVKSESVRREGDRIVAIEFHSAMASWATHTDPIAAAKSGRTTIEMPVADDATKSEASSASGNDDEPKSGRDPHGFYEARARTENFRAKQAELDYLQAVGKLVSAAGVQDEVTDIFATVKSNVFRIADRKAQVLAAEIDPTRTHSLLVAEFQAVFDELSRRFAIEASRGVEGSQAALS